MQNEEKAVLAYLAEALVARPVSATRYVALVQEQVAAQGSEDVKAALVALQHEFDSIAARGQVSLAELWAVADRLCGGSFAQHSASTALYGSLERTRSGQALDTQHKWKIRR